MRPDPQVAPGRAARIGAQLLRAVAHLEAHDVVHRDVKLDNVLLDGAGDELNERVVRQLLRDRTAAVQPPGRTPRCQIAPCGDRLCFNQRAPRAGADGLRDVLRLPQEPRRGLPRDAARALRGV